MPAVSTKNILITGTSTGLGFLTAHTLVKEGHHVFASMREAEGRNAERAAALQASVAGATGKLHILSIDVTNDQSVETGVAQAIEQAGFLDVVINNAGIGGGGHCEAFTPEQFQQVFEVNVFGVQRVMRAVLPHMRARKQGLCIQISSGVGRFVAPYMGPYSPSKFALESLSEGYAYELHGTGVEVSIVEPGPYQTEFISNMLAAEDSERVASYGELADAPTQAWAGMRALFESGNAPSAQLIGDAIAKLIATPAGEKPLRVVVDPIMGHFLEEANDTLSKVQQQISTTMSGN